MIDEIQLSIEAPLAKITISRPAKKNAMSPAMHRAMHQALDAIEAAGDIKVVILTGVDDVFCGGMDLSEYFFKSFGEPKRFHDNLRVSHSWMRRWKDFPAVTLARVNGWCVGGGLLMASICDIVITAAEATFCLSEVNFGIFPSGGTTWGVARNFNAKQALYYMLTAERFAGDKAVELGLANTSVPRSQLDEETARVVELLSQKNVHALRYTKKVYERVRSMNYPDAQQFEVAMLMELSYRTEDAWVKKALAQFEQKQYRPGLDAYDEGDGHP